MRAVVVTVDRRAAPRQAGRQLTMNVVEERLVDDAAGNCGLVRDDDQGVAGPLEQAQRVRRPGKHGEQLHPIEVAPLLDERAVAIKKDGGIHYGRVCISTRTDSKTRSGRRPFMQR